MIDEMFKGIPVVGVVGGAGLLFLVLVWAASNAQRIFNNWKVDKLDSSVLTRLAEAEARIIELSDTIHDHAIDLTLAQMMILKMYHQMKDEGMDIPPEVQDYVNEMMSRRGKKKGE